MQNLPSRSNTGICGRALLGFMDREEAVRFLKEDCVFSDALSEPDAEELWQSRRAIVENLGADDPRPLQTLPLSEADLKAARKFRSRHPDETAVVDFVRLNPMDLVVHKLWISTAIADRYRDKTTPDKWLRAALLEPVSDPALKWRREENTIIFDLPRAEYVLAGPNPNGALWPASALDFVTVAFHAGRALLMNGYHRTFASAQYALEAPNAPRGILFGLSSYLASMGEDAREVLNLMERARPPRIADFFDPRLFTPVTLRERRYQMRIHYEVIESSEKEFAAIEPAARQQADMLSGHRDWRAIFEDAERNFQAGRIDAAVAQYQRVLFLRPDNAEASNNLGVALAAQGRTAEAIERYERALTLRPDYVDAHYNLGLALAAQGKPVEAIAHQKRAAAIEPGNARVLNQLAAVCASLGMFEDALAHYRKAIATHPDSPEVHFSLAALKTYRRGDPDLAALEALAGRDAGSKAPLIHFALAKALEDIGEYDRAFEHLRTGNAVKRHQIEYDEPALLALFRRVAAVFDRNLLDQFPGMGDLSAAPVFVLGMPRSGSTLVEQILASHPQVHAVGEQPYIEETISGIGQVVGSAFRYPEDVPRLDAEALRKIGFNYLSRLCSSTLDKARTVDKTPASFVHIGLIRLMLPNARIIHTVRDPIDTCVSCFSTLFHSGQNYAYDLAELGRCYRAYAALMAHWHSVLPPGDMLEVRYENVVADIEGQARRLIEYCDLPWDDRCLHFQETSRVVKTASLFQVRQPLFRSSVERWRRYEPWLGPLIRELKDVDRQSLASRV